MWRFQVVLALTGSYEDYKQFLAQPITSADQACDLFPKTTVEFDALKENTLRAISERVALFYKISLEQTTIEAFINLLDDVYAAQLIVESVCAWSGMLYPEQALRDYAQKTEVDFANKIEQFYDVENSRLYAIAKHLSNTVGCFEHLSKKDEYLFTKIMRDFRLKGLDLSAKDRLRLLEIKKRLNVLTADFFANVAKDKSTVEVSPDELLGVNADVLASLQRIADNKYIVACDGPIYREILGFCTNEATRKLFWLKNAQRAYPVNEEILKDILQLRHEMALLLGFENYAALDIFTQSAKKISEVELFLNGIEVKARNKSADEFKRLTAELPVGVVLNKDGCMNPWDYAFVRNFYKKKFYDLDENFIAEYFPVDKTLPAMLDIYENFFDVRFERTADFNAWHTSVKLIKITRNRDNQFLGHLFLDLYPRDGKNKHAYCGLLYPTTTKKDEITGLDVVVPGVAIMSANLPVGSQGKPALFKFEDVSTFFHEFGHGMHALLGATSRAMTGMNGAPMDFLEMPSQMFEQWLLQVDILQKISGHYETGEPLPKELISKKIHLKNLTSGDHVLQQIFFAKYALQLHLGEDVNPYELHKNLIPLYRTFTTYNEQARWYTSFEHLMGYASKYYVYLWSEVYALDIFDHIRKAGLDKSEVGNVFLERILRRCGEMDSLEMLREYLGRRPSQDAFMAGYGF